MNDFKPSAVACRGLCKSFSSKAETLRILRGVNLEIPNATTCSIVGPSGSGKSTLLSILGGLERADAGEILVAGTSLYELPEKRLAAFRADSIGFVFQFHYLLKDFDALENVALPAYMAGIPRREAWAKAESLLEKVGLSARKHHFPSELSGGERQRTAIARALINSPAIVLADEPTGNLDTETGKKIEDILVKLNAEKKITLIVVTHNKLLADRMSGGSVARARSAGDVKFTSTRIGGSPTRREGIPPGSVNPS